MEIFGEDHLQVDWMCLKKHIHDKERLDKLQHPGTCSTVYDEVHVLGKFNTEQDRQHPRAPGKRKVH